MLLEPQELPAELFEGWEAEFVESTALSDRYASYTPTGPTPNRSATQTQRTTMAASRPAVGAKSFCCVFCLALFLSGCVAASQSAPRGILVLYRAA